LIGATRTIVSLHQNGVSKASFKYAINPLCELSLPRICWSWAKIQPGAIGRLCVKRIMVGIYIYLLPSIYTLFTDVENNECRTSDCRHAQLSSTNPSACPILIFCPFSTFHTHPPF